ncbi:MAG TPA: sulfatase-like hydrolase/transferase [Vicinamibacteria bacterium]|nr:sulfatase-like hydrolase/transferase [Vicinamibacteria bacterium]
MAPSERGPFSRAFVPVASLLPFAMLAKAAHFGGPGGSYTTLQFLRDVVVSSASDLVFTLGAFLLVALLLAALPGEGARRALAFAVVALGAACAVYSVASVQIFDYLRSPLTYPLLYLASDMQTMGSSIGSFVTPLVGAALVLAPLLYLALVRAGRGFVLRPGAVAALLLGCAAWGAVAYRQTVTGRWLDRNDHLIVRSPHWEIVSSTVVELFLGGRSERFDESFSEAELRDFQGTPEGAWSRPAQTAAPAPPRNVLVVVMESTGAKYLSLYGSRYDTTPELRQEARFGLVYDNFYCHMGLTANSLAALSLSIFPYMTWREYTVEYPTYPGTTLAQLLKPHGYRTAFIHTGYLQYTNQDRFLANRGFDRLLDIEDLGGQVVSSWGGDDRQLVDAVLKWIDEDPARPFHVMAWTNESHHPYEPAPHYRPVGFFEDGKLPPDDYDLGRYLNTVRSVDHELGRLFQGLRERGRDRDTLVVVTGDHGEAFGDPHATWGHGARIYEENVRVPLLLWSPALFPSGRRVATIGSHVDVMPTIAHLLDLPPAPTWEGRSLFEKDRPPRAYFYAANDDYLLGVREGNWKYIYNVTRGRDELFDLARDPDEQTNLASQNPELCRRLRRHLAAWRSYVKGELERLRPAG